MRRKIATAGLVAVLLVANASPGRAADTIVQPPPSIHVKRTAPLVAGSILFGLTYGIAVFGSVLAWSGAPDAEQPCSDCHLQAGLFAIPVVGPLLSDAAVAPAERGPLWLDLTWSGLEAAGLAMIIVGAIGHDVPVLPLPTAPLKVTVVPLMTAQVGLLSVRMAW